MALSASSVRVNAWIVRMTPEERAAFDARRKESAARRARERRASLSETDHRAHRAKENAYKRKNYDADRERVQAYRRKYGMHPSEVECLFRAQGGLCAICGAGMQLFQGSPSKSACIDHCHATGRVRGLLCNYCNRGIGFLRDDPALLERAVSYLRKAA